MLDTPIITIQRGIPFPPARPKDDNVSLSDIIAKLKKGESFLVAPDLRCRVLTTASYMARTGKINFCIKTRTVNEGGLNGLRCWRVEP